MPKTYTAKKIAEALAWKEDLCKRRAMEVYNGRRGREGRCDDCPVGDPCYQCTENGMENILRRFKEVRANESI